MKSYINKKGYVIKKENYDDLLLEEIRKELTVKPNINEDYGTKAVPYKVYREGKTKMYLPKFYAIKKLGKTIIKMSDGLDIDVVFKGSLRKNQEIPTQKTLDQMTNIGGGLLSLPCGFGKTCIALYILSKLKKKTLIVVNQEFLMDQWIDRINTFLPGLRIGKVQQKKVEVEGYDISLAMLKSLAIKDYPDDTFNDIGFVIVDECHNIATKEYSKALQKINSKYMLGLSATPKRKDGLTKVIKWFIGEIYYQTQNTEPFKVLVERLIIKSDNKEYNKLLVNYKGKPFIAKMITQVAEYDKRTKIIADKILEVIKNDSNVQILLLSERKVLLYNIEELIKGKCSYGFFIGGMKQVDRKESMSKQLILATFHIAREALDIKSLNTLFLATSKSDIIQAVGRILREKHGKHIIVDIVDNFSSFANQARNRLRYYDSKGYSVKDIYITDDGEIINTLNRVKKIKIVKNKKNNNKPMFAMFK